MSELLHAPGFLGTNANFAADMTLLLSVLVGLLFTAGALIARRAQRIERQFPPHTPQRGKAAALFRRHRWIQTAAALTNIVLVLWLMVLPYRDFVLRDSGGPRPSSFYLVTTTHALVGLFAFVFGNFVVLRGNNLMIPALRFSNYKPYMRIAYLAYMLTTLLGIWVYITWFVSLPNPPQY